MTDPDQGLEIHNQWIPRARLGLHLRLGIFAAQIEAALEEKAAEQVAILMTEYFKMVSFDTSQLSNEQKLGAYLKLSELNKLKLMLPFQKWSKPEGSTPPPYDYPGRTWAWWIHKLASRYGWTREQIFNLWPEEAAAYLQEIIVAEYDESDEARSLSQIAYHYDKQTKKATFRPLPRPAWMREKEEPRIRRIRRDWLPVGNVIDLSHKTDFFLN